MPDIIPRPCRHPRCPGTTIQGCYCNKHRPLYKAAYKQRFKRQVSASSDYQHRLKFYNSNIWKRARIRYLSAHPMCEAPNCGMIATDVDHITPLSEGGEPLSEDNFQALCRQCHSQKTSREVRRRQRRGAA